VFKEITFIDQNNAMAICQQGEVYLAQSKPLWAEKYYKNALKLNPRLGLAEYGLAKIAKLRNKNSLYRQHLNRAYQLSPNDPEIKTAYKNK
jgi:Tfp pilus assembly protein PilF